MLFLTILNSFLLLCSISTIKASRNTMQTCSAIKKRHFFDLLSPKFPSAHHPFRSRVSPPDCNDDTNVTIDGMCPSLLTFDHPVPTTPPMLFPKRNVTLIDEGHKIATFEEWTRQKLEQELKKAKATNIGIPSSPEIVRPITETVNLGGASFSTLDSPPANEAATTLPSNEAVASQPITTGPTIVKSPVIPVFATAAKRNYASRECGSKVIDANPETENRGAVLNDKEKDDYMRNPCKDAASKFLVIELCETIQTKTIEIANFELFSSSPKEFRLLASERYPSLEWVALGTFTAEDNRNIQSFTVPAHGTYAKFLRLELDTHYGTEHYCTLSSLRVYGISMVDEYEAEANAAALGVLDVPEVAVEKPVTTEFQSPPAITLPDEEKLNEIPIKGQTQKILPWQFRDCQKCEGSQYHRDAITTWLCYVFSTPSTCSLERDCIPSGSTCARVGRSRSQARFLNLILKPRAVCLKGHAPHVPSSPVAIPTPVPVLTAADVPTETFKKQTVVTPPPSPTSGGKNAHKTPLPAGTTSHKESVFLKLNKRLAQLELNISLSSQYLTELSRQYVAQTEATTYNQAHLEKHISEAVANVSTRLASQIASEINGVRQEMANLAHRFYRFVAAVRMNHMATTTATTFSNYFSGNSCSEGTRDIAMRTVKEKQWDDEIDLDVADGMWTTQQLVILVALMQTTTFLMMLIIIKYYNRSMILETSQLEVMKQQILKELLESNTIVDKNSIPAISSTISEVPQIESTPTMPSTVSSQSSPNLVSSVFEQSKKKRKRRNKQSINEANNQMTLMSPPATQTESITSWDSTSGSSSFSSISSGVTPVPKKKISTTSRDSCFNSDGAENISPLNHN